jgi:hypothetical protein
MGLNAQKRPARTPIALKTEDRQPPPAPPKAPICREIRPVGVGPGSACHAEGRGFESLQPLRKRPAFAGLFRVISWVVRLPSWGTESALARVPYRDSALKACLCRYFVTTRTADLCGHGRGRRFDSRHVPNSPTSHGCECVPRLKHRAIGSSISQESRRASTPTSDCWRSSAARATEHAPTCPLSRARQRRPPP